MSKTIVITGAGRGIGRAVALEFAKSNARIVLSSRTAAELEKVAADVVAAGGHPLAVSCDVGVESEVRALMTAAVEFGGVIDVLVCAAGVARIAPFDELSLADWELTLRTNLTGTFLACRDAVNHMSAGSTMILLSSIAGRTGFPTWSAYSAAKFGVMGFAQAIREEVRSRGIRVTALVSAAVDTPLWDDVPGSWSRERMLQPEEVARTIVQIAEQPTHIQLDEVVIGHMAGRL